MTLHTDHMHLTVSSADNWVLQVDDLDPFQKLLTHYDEDVAFTVDLYLEGTL